MDNKLVRKYNVEPSTEQSTYSGIQRKMITDHSDSANYARNVFPKYKHDMNIGE
jgi:hypothetical protein